MKKIKILVVEDEPVTRMIMQNNIESAKYEVKAAENGADGFELFKSFKPDIVFSDISMPVMDGLKLLEEIRRIDYEAIVIMTTAFGSTEYTLQALRLRANDYLVKPISKNMLLPVLAKYSAIISERTFESEITDLIIYKELAMKLDNSLDKIGRVVDRLIQETEGRIKNKDRLGVRLGLMEIILNALEHGNLGITYDEKSKIMDGDPEDWHRLIEERSRMKPYKDRKIIIKFKMFEDICEWLIIDEGEGFDWKNLPSLNDPDSIFETHGRGIMLTRMNFDQVEFLGKGNQVRLRKKIVSGE
ncbi:MAG: ATP-binding protein [Candidatus Rifleibacteriota bacterium]